MFLFIEIEYLPDIAWGLGYGHTLNSVVEYALNSVPNMHKVMGAVSSTATTSTRTKQRKVIYCIKKCCKLMLLFKIYLKSTAFLLGTYTFMKQYGARFERKHKITLVVISEEEN